MGTKQTYPPMGPKWEKATILVKADKVYCACFHVHTHSQCCALLAHAGLVISKRLEGAQRIIAAYVEKNKLWEEANTTPPPPPPPTPRGQSATSSDKSPPPPIPATAPLPALNRPNYWDDLGSDSDDDADFRSEIDLDHPQGANSKPEAAEGGVLVNNIIKNIYHYFPSARRLVTNRSAPSR